ncbi:MAG TPA: hypothetical protein VM243_13615 [Phycisphaerae bacterium]|nr:hypothetical protein [Phycisphaerae bacterium]
MKFRITGAERLTGDDVDLILEAPTHAAAEAKAHRLNVLIEQLELLGPTLPVPARPPVPVPVRAPVPVPTPAPVVQPPKRPSAPAEPSNWGQAALLVLVVLVGLAIYWSNPDTESKPQTG